jgi:phage tail tape-measure protein
MAKVSGKVNLSDLLKSSSNLENLQTAPATLNRDPAAGPTDTQRTLQELSKSLESIGNTLVKGNKEPGSRTQAESVTISTSTKIFEEFVKQTRKREDMLKDATKEQKNIFKRLENVIIKLQTAGSKDTAALKKSIDALIRKLGQTPKTEAREKIKQAMGPEYRAPAYAAAASPMGYDMYKGSGTEGAIGENGAGVAAGAEPQEQSDIFSHLGDWLTTAMGINAAKDILTSRKNTPGGGGEAGTKSKPSRPTGQVYKNKAGRWMEVQASGKSQFIKKPSVARRGFQAVKNVGGILGKGLGHAGLLGVGFAGLDAYEGYNAASQSEMAGELTHAQANEAKGTAIGGATGGLAGGLAGTYAGAATGAAIGTAIFPGVGTAIGGLIGGVAGGWGGAELGSDVGGKAGGALVKNVSSTEKSQQIQQLSQQNKMANMNSNQAQAPVVINNQAPAMPAQPQNILLPPGTVRPTESALNRWTFQNYQA